MPHTESLPTVGLNQPKIICGGISHPLNRKGLVFVAATVTNTGEHVKFVL